VRIDADGSVTVIANGYQGKRIGRPNDVVVKSDGSIYFTDPAGGATGDPWRSRPRVYRVSADLGSMSLLSDSFLTPNGSPSRPTKPCSTSTIRAGVTFAPSISCPTASSPSRPTASLPN